LLGESLNASADDDVLMEEPMDSYDLADPIDITTNLPGNFYELLVSAV
jgi:cytoskeleton-associated protein 5